MVWSSPIQREESIEIPLTYSKDSVLVNYDSKVTQLFTCLENSGWEEAIDLCKEQPSQASVWVYRLDHKSENVRWQMLPLHAAIIFKGNDEILEALLQAYPEGATMADDQGMLPLHLAFLKDMSENMINRLISLYPESVNRKDKMGRTPISLLVSKIGSGENSNNLVRLYFTSMLKERDDEITSILSTNEALQEQLVVENENKNKIAEMEELLSREKAKASTLAFELQIKTNLAHSLYNEVHGLKDSKMRMYNLKSSQSGIEIEVKEPIPNPIEQRDEDLDCDNGNENLNPSLRVELEELTKRYNDLDARYKEEIKTYQENSSTLEKNMHEAIQKHKEIATKNEELRDLLIDKRLEKSLEDIFHASDDECTIATLLDPKETDVKKVRTSLKKLKEEFDVLSVLYAQEKETFSEQTLTLQKKLAEAESSQKEGFNTMKNLKELIATNKEKDEEIEALTLDCENILKENDELNTIIDSLQNELKEKNNVETCFKENEYELVSYMNDLVSAISEVKQSMDPKEEVSQNSVTRIDLKIQSAILNIKYIRMKFEEYYTLSRDHEKLRQDMNELFAINTQLRKKTQKRYESGSLNFCSSRNVCELEDEMENLVIELNKALSTNTDLERQLEKLQKQNFSTKDLRSVKEENKQLKNEISHLKEAFRKNRSDAQLKMQSFIFDFESREDGLKELILLHSEIHVFDEKVSECKARVEKLTFSEKTDHIAKALEKARYELLMYEQERSNHLEIVSRLKKHLEDISNTPRVGRSKRFTRCEVSKAYVKYEQTISDLMFLLDNEKKNTRILATKNSMLE